MSAADARAPVAVGREVALPGIELWVPIYYGTVIAACLLVLTRMAHLFESPSAAFSSHIALRVQTEALLRGKLTLLSSPRQLSWDWTWGRGGCYQAWGLGVPALRLPFDLAAKALGAPGFPDRLTFLLYAAGAMTLLAAGLHGCGASRKDASLKVANALHTSLWICVATLSPAFVALLGAKLEAYEEVVAYGCLWDFALLGLLLMLARRPRASLLGIVSILSGLPVLIRPTQLFYGLATVVVALVAARRIVTRKSMALAILAFSCGPTAALALDWARFGSPWELGYGLQVSGTIANEFALRFGHPFLTEPLGRAARELLAIVFGDPHLNRLHFYEAGFFPGQSSTPRLRELYFHTFDRISGCLLVFSLPLVALDLLASRRSRDPGLGPTTPSWLLSLWTWTSAVPLFYLYLRVQGISSRYVLDFFPALVASFVALAHSGARLLVRRFPDRRVALSLPCAFAIALGVWGASAPKAPARTPFEQTASEPATAEEVGERVARAVATPGTLDVPTDLVCPCKDAGSEIPFNPQGWNAERDCSVTGPLSAVFLQPSRAIELTVDADPSTWSDGSMLVQVKSGIHLLGCVEKNGDGSRHVLTFCCDDSRSDDPYPRLVSIGWIPPANLGRPLPNIVLKRVRGIDGPFDGTEARP